jgi:hypothetical protein
MSRLQRPLPDSKTEIDVGPTSEITVSTQIAHCSRYDIHHLGNPTTSKRQSRDKFLRIVLLSLPFRALKLQMC